MKRWVGRSMVLIGVIHTVAGFVRFWDVLPPIAREGFLNTIRRDTHAARGGAFWFFFLGFLLLVFGALVDHVEGLGVRLPAFLPWSLLAFCVLGVAMAPASGFWLMFVPIVGAFLQASRRSGGRLARGPAPSADSPVMPLRATRDLQKAPPPAQRPRPGGLLASYGILGLGSKRISLRLAADALDVSHNPVTDIGHCDGIESTRRAGLCRTLGGAVQGARLARAAARARHPH